MRAGRPEAAAAIWTWQRASAEEHEHAARSARRRGSLQGAVGLGAGLLLAWLASPRVGLVVASIASLITATAWLSPLGAYAWIERAFEALGRGVGGAMSWILMPILFVMIFLPFGVLMRRGRKDPLKRFFEAGASSYWKVRDPEREAERSYQRPF